MASTTAISSQVLKADIVRRARFQPDRNNVSLHYYHRDDRLFRATSAELAAIQ
jgi:hypothetical protein